MDYGNGRYEIEVWNKLGKNLGDIRHLCSSLKWTMQRNSHETVQFSMDLARYEDYLARNNTLVPTDFMDVLTTDIRIKREGKYLLGANVIKFSYSPTDASVTITVDCSGYLNFYKDQYVDISYDNVDQGDVMWGVIAQCNAKTGGDYGVQKGTFVSRKKKRNWHESRKNVKDFLQRKSKVIDGADFEFTYDKKFNTYDKMGTYRPDVKLIYPENVESFDFERSGDSLANAIIAIGSGNGEDAIFYDGAVDYSSIGDRYRHEKIVTFNSVEESDTLKENADGVLQLLSEPRELPKFTIHDGILDLNDIHIGDTIYIELQKFASLKHIKGYYRIERIECSVDAQDAETVTITFDDLDIDSIISEQPEE